MSRAKPKSERKDRKHYAPVIIDGLARKEATYKFTQEFIDKRVKVDSIRDIWYKIKAKMEPWKPYTYEAILDDLDGDNLKATKELSHREEGWGVAINTFIGAYLFDCYKNIDKNIYRLLGITPKDFIEGAKNTPIILAAEKNTSKLRVAAYELDAPITLSQGHFSLYEIAYMIDYLKQSDYDDAYIIVISDYDPKGIEIYESIKKTILPIFNEVSSKHVRILRVKYGDNHSEIIEKYDNYQLPPSQLKQWNEAGMGSRGVEMNVIYDIVEHLDRCIIENVNPEILEQLSLSRAIETRIQQKLHNSSKYNKALTETQRIYEDITQEVYSRPYEFDPEALWFAPVTFGMVEEMTTID